MVTETGEPSGCCPVNSPRSADSLGTVEMASLQRHALRCAFPDSELFSQAKGDDDLKNVRFPRCSGNLHGRNNFASYIHLYY